MEQELMANMIDSDAVEINQLYDEFCGDLRTTLQKAIQIGERLISKKAKLGHGQWIPWIESNLKFGRPQAWRFMSCYKKRTNVASKQHLTIEEFAQITKSLPEEKQKKEKVDPDPIKDDPKTIDIPSKPIVQLYQENQDLASEDSKKFYTTWKEQNQTPLSSEDGKWMLNNLKGDWKALEDKYNNEQLKEIVYLQLYFWETKRKKFWSTSEDLDVIDEFGPDYDEFFVLKKKFGEI